MNYIPLNVKTEYSLLSSMIKIDDLVNYASKYNLTSLAICDNTMFGVMEFVKKCREKQIKPIIGLEVEIDKMKILLYAKDYIGYQSLLKLTTIASKDNLTLSDLEKNYMGLICVVPYDSMNLYDTLVKIYETIFKGYSNLLEKESLKSNNSVYINPIYYLEAKDREYYPYLEAMRLGKTLNDIIVDPNIYSFNIEEINEKNNQVLADMCQVDFKKADILLPIYECPDGMDGYSYLKRLCKEGLKRIFGERVNRIYIERLKYELEVINQMGFCNYFLVVWDYVSFAKKNGILVGPGRGSAAGSLVSYCLGITTVDPIKYNLLFERFLNPERISMPDIDIDFEYNRREEVINYCISKYGLKKVAGIITFGTLAAKQVIRDVARTLDIDLKVVDNVCNKLNPKLSLIDNYNSNKFLQNIIKEDPELIKLYKIAMKFEGLKRHTSIHAAGIVMCRYDLDEIIPLNYNHENFYTTGYSMEYLEELGLLKMDFLALKNLTLISDCLASLKKAGIDIDFDNIPMNDKETIKIFTDVNTIGIFQFESAGMMNFLRKFKPNSFEEVSAAIALFRPGPMKNIDSFIKRKRGLEKIDYVHEDLKPVLASTYGIMIYQEQVMQVANIMAGYSLAEADVLRKAISKKKENVLKEERDKFISRSIKKGYSNEVATKVYDLILEFASYGFNRAHSVAYSVIAYKMAYLKAHYKAYFMKELLSMVIGSEIKTKEYVYECKLNNIKVINPSINISTDTYVVTNRGIVYPLTAIHNVGTSAVNTIINERNKGRFIDIYDFICRCYGKSINKKTLEALIDAGVFEEFNLNRKTLRHNLDVIINYSELIHDLDPSLVEKPILEQVEDFSNKELMQLELDSYGFYISNHPVTEYRLKYPNTVEIGAINKYFDRVINLICYVDKIKKINTKKNEDMVFITGSDEINTLDVVLFPKVYERYRDIEVGNVIFVNGKVEKRFDKLQLVVNSIKVLNK